jgi:hypothetical protein
MGRRLKFRTDCPLGTSCDEASDAYETQPHNRLLVSIVQAFGVETDDFGRQPLYANSRGPLPGL